LIRIETIIRGRRRVAFRKMDLIEAVGMKCRGRNGIAELIKVLLTVRRR
jgi:hypothetical protein